MYRKMSRDKMDILVVYGAGSKLKQGDGLWSWSGIDYMNPIV